MPRASRRMLSKTIYQEMQENFSFLISSLRSETDIEQFFSDFLSEEEQVMLTKRLMLHMMLENQYTMSEIQSVLGMSRETIRVHLGIYKKGGSSYKKMIRQIAKREKAKAFWKSVEKILAPLDLVLKSKTNMKARAKLLNGDL